MKIYIYDRTFEGLLTVLFDAYFRKSFPDVLLMEGEPLPLFCDEVVCSVTEPAKAERVWKGLGKKLSPQGLGVITSCWLSELPDIEMPLLRYMRKAIDSPSSIELDFGNPDVLEVSRIAKKVNQERLRVVQFVRFQKGADNTFYAALEPLYNVLPLSLSYFKDRFAGQKWMLYDIKRKYGYYYDMHSVTEVRFDEEQGASSTSFTGRLAGELMAADEKQFQQLWQTYFKAIAIKERTNPRLHRQNLPVRFWKYLTEKYE